MGREDKKRIVLDPDEYDTLNLYQDLKFKMKVFESRLNPKSELIFIPKSPTYRGIISKYKRR